MDQPHPSNLASVQYELLEDMSPETLNHHRVTGPQIFTDGSKIEDRVGAALTWWEEGREINHNLFSLNPACTVFQSELYALMRAAETAETSGYQTVNILSDSRSSLDLLKNAKTCHPIARAIKESLRRAKTAGTEIRLFWLRAHVGIAGNERADELAKAAALRTQERYDYAKIPISYVKKKIREETVRKWQDRYNSSSTGSVTKTFLPDVSKAHRIILSMGTTPIRTQVLTGHGGIAEYLHRFKLKSSPGCECDDDISESVWHIILECPRFGAARSDLETRLDKKLAKSELQNVITDPKSRPHFLSFAENSFLIASRRNAVSSVPSEQRPPSQTSVNPVPTASTSAQTAPTIQVPRRVTDEAFLSCGEDGEPGLRTRGVALFMDVNSERLGIGFCNLASRKYVTISPGLAVLLNGSTSRTSMRRKTYDALAEVELADRRCRIVRAKNKIIALFEGNTEESQFAQACSVLASFGEAEPEVIGGSRIISVDAMVVAHLKGQTVDRMGAIRASQRHEVVVYEDRGEDLSFLKAPQTAAATQNPTGENGTTNAETTMTGSERLEQRLVQQRKTEGELRKKIQKMERTAALERLKLSVKLFNQSSRTIQKINFKNKATIRSVKVEKEQIEALIEFLKEPKAPLEPLKPKPTMADLGLVQPPIYIEADKSPNHFVNAFLEFVALTKATLEANAITCKEILKAYRIGARDLLDQRLEKAEAAIHNSTTSTIIRGKCVGKHMAAYNETTGFVALDENEFGKTSQLRFGTPPNDPIAVTTKNTKIMLDDRILRMAISMVNDLSSGANWDVPLIEWVNGVPGCGKTSWVISSFDIGHDIVITTTVEAAKDLREKLAYRMGTDAAKKVRTMASMLINGVSESERTNCKRILIDEALMNHFGAIVMATRITGASEVVLIGDQNQLPYIERNNLFPLEYCRPDLVTAITKELLCTHRNPMDVAYALSEVYSGIYSSKCLVHSLTLERFTGARIEKTLPNTLYLVLTQVEKKSLIHEGFGIGENSRTLTVHEAQGLTYETVVIVRADTSKMQLHDSVPHAVVAISRHTQRCIYYTDNTDDAIARFITRAQAATASKIRDYNLRMAVKARDEATIKIIVRAEGRKDTIKETRAKAALAAPTTSKNTKKVNNFRKLLRNCADTIIGIID